MALSQHQAAPTPRVCGRSKDKKTQKMSVVDFAIWDDLEVILNVYKAAPKARNYSQTLKK